MGSFTKAIIGEITLTTTNEKTGVVKTKVIENITTGHFSDGIASNASKISFGDNNGRTMGCSSLLVEPDHSGTGRFQAERQAPVVVASELSSDPFLTDGSDFWAERVYRFASTGSIETINVIFLHESTSAVTIGSRNNVLNYAVLGTPYLQDEVEVLDIKIRWIFVMPSSKGVEIWLKHLLKELTMGDFNSKDNEAHFLGLNASAEWLKFPYASAKRLHADVNIDGTLGHSESNKDIANSTSIGIGDLVNFKLTSKGLCKTAPANLETSMSICGAVTPFIEDDKRTPNYPLGPLYNHNSDATNWCEDITQLATGLGYPSVSQVTPTWDTGAMNDWYVMQITKSGNLGTARFVFKNSDMKADQVRDSGFPMLSHLSSLASPPAMSGIATPTHADYLERIKPPLADTLLLLTQYDAETLVGCNEDALSLINIYTGKYKQFDVSTAPIKPVFSQWLIGSRHICRNDAGTIYFINPDDGLMKLENPWAATPTMTTITKATVGNTTTLRGIAHGPGRLWVTSDEGIFYSDDDGATFTAQAAWSNPNPNGAVTISQNRINSIHCDPKNDNKLVLGFSSTTTGNINERSEARTYYVYFDGTTTNTVFDVVGNGGTADMREFNHTSVVSRWSTVVCEPKNGLWLFEFNNFNAGCRKVLGVFNSTTYKEVGVKTGTTSSYGAGGGYTYDRLGNLCMMVTADTAKHSCMGNLRGNMYGAFETLNSSTSMSLGGNGLHYLKQGTSDPENTSAFLMRICKVFGNGTASADENKYPVVSRPMPLAIAAPYPKTAATVFNETMPSSHMLSEFDWVPQPYNYNATLSTWVYNYNAVTPESTDGSNAADGIRVNFPADENKFNGRSYIDLQAVTDGSAFNANGLSVAIKIDPEAKLSNSNAPNHLDIDYSHNEIGTSCLFSMYDATTDRSFDIMYIDKDDNIAVIDKTNGVYTTSVIAATGAIAIHRYVVTLASNGMDLVIYQDGASIGTYSLTNAMTMLNGSNELRIVLGMSQWDETFSVNLYEDGFKGEMINVQVWENVLSAGQVTSDWGITTGGGLIAPSTDLLSRYLLTADYSEGKTITAVSNTFKNDFEVTFVDGDLSTDSYVKGDNYRCLSAKYGILKGNVESFIVEDTSSIFGKGSTDLKDSNASAVVPAAAIITTQPAFLTKKSHDNQYSRSCVTNAEAHTLGIMQDSPQGNNYSYTFVLGALEDGELRAGIGSTAAFISAGSSMPWLGEMEINSTGTAMVIESDATASASFAVNYGVGDSIKLAFVTATNKFEVSLDTGAGFVLVASIAMNAPLAPISGGFSMLSNNPIVSVHNVEVTYLAPAGLMFFGDNTAKTGVFSDSYNILTMQELNAVVVEADGVEMGKEPIIADYDIPNGKLGFITNLVAPPAGSVSMGVYTGFCLFNPAEAGDTVVATEYLTQGLGTDGAN